MADAAMTGRLTPDTSGKSGKTGILSPQQTAEFVRDGMLANDRVSRARFDNARFHG